MHYENISHEERLRLERAEADERSLQWDEYFCYATVFVAVTPVISMSLINSGIEPFRKLGTELHHSISIYQLLYSWVLGAIHFFRLIMRLEQDNSKGGNVLSHGNSLSDLF